MLKHELPFPMSFRKKYSFKKLLLLKIIYYIKNGNFDKTKINKKICMVRLTTEIRELSIVIYEIPVY